MEGEKRSKIFFLLARKTSLINWKNQVRLKNEKKFLPNGMKTNRRQVCKSGCRSTKRSTYERRTALTNSSPPNSTIRTVLAALPKCLQNIGTDVIFRILWEGGEGEMRNCTGRSDWKPKGIKADSTYNLCSRTAKYAKHALRSPVDAAQTAGVIRVCRCSCRTYKTLQFKHERRSRPTRHHFKSINQSIKSIKSINPINQSN